MAPLGTVSHIFIFLTDLCNKNNIGDKFNYLQKEIHTNFISPHIEWGCPKKPVEHKIFNNRMFDTLDYKRTGIGNSITQLDGTDAETDDLAKTTADYDHINI